MRTASVQSSDCLPNARTPILCPVSVYSSRGPICLSFSLQGQCRPKTAAATTLMPTQFPFNNDCSVNTSMLKDLKVGQLNVQFAPDVNKHVKKTLPPSLSGFPGEAEIKYYVKATVVRPKFYQENFRTVCSLTMSWIFGLTSSRKRLSSSSPSRRRDLPTSKKRLLPDASSNFKNTRPNHSGRASSSKSLLRPRSLNRSLPYSKWMLDFQTRRS